MIVEAEKKAMSFENSVTARDQARYVIYVYVFAVIYVYVFAVIYVCVFAVIYVYVFALLKKSFFLMHTLCFIYAQICVYHIPIQYMDISYIIYISYHIICISYVPSNIRISNLQCS